MDKDIVIIGGGPAALAAAIYASRAQLQVLIVERAIIGGQSSLTFDIANYPGFPDGIDGPELAERMQKQAEKFGTVFRQEEAQQIDPQKDGTFLVEFKQKTVRTKCVIIASGSDPRKLEVEGENELRGRGVSYCGTCDGPFFRNKKVFVVGGGDSALKEGLHIAKFASQLTVVHRRDSFRAEKFYQKQIFEHAKIKVIWNSTVIKIQGKEKVESVILKDTVSGKENESETDGVFIFVGTSPNTHFLCNVLPTDCGGHVTTDLNMMTRVAGLFAIGDVREHSFRQIATAVGEGATAAIAAEHYISDLQDTP